MCIWQAADNFVFPIVHLETVQITQDYIHVGQSTIYVNESLLLCIYLLVLIMVGLVRLYKHIYDIAWWCNFFFFFLASFPHIPITPPASKIMSCLFLIFQVLFFPPPSCCSRFSTWRLFTFSGGISCCNLHDDICAKVVMLFLCYFWLLPFGHFHILTLHAGTLTVDRRDWIGKGVCERSTGTKSYNKHILQL